MSHTLSDLTVYVCASIPISFLKSLRQAEGREIVLLKYLFA